MSIAPNTPPLPTAADYEALLRDANRWRALLGSGRLRWLGSAGLDISNNRVTAKEETGYMHFGMEFWSIDPTSGAVAEGNQLSKNILIAYADEILRLSK